MSATAARISALHAFVADPLQIEALAKQVTMSPSALHHYFKAVTAMSPVQYRCRNSPD